MGQKVQCCACEEEVEYVCRRSVCGSHCFLKVDPHERNGSSKGDVSDHDGVPVGVDDIDQRGTDDYNDNVVAEGGTPSCRWLNNDTAVFTSESSKKGCSYFDIDVPELEAIDDTSSSPLQKPHDDGPLPGPLGSRAFHFKSQSSYTGQWKGKQRHGFGIQKWPDGAEYKGQWVNNRVEGMGRFRHRNHDTYFGQWLANQAHGYGNFRHYDHLGVTIYKGKFFEDRLHGYGVQTRGEGSRYEGTSYAGVWRNGEKEGHGVYSWPDSACYEGKWKNNSINGPGRYCGLDGRTYLGEWKSSKMHGIGEFKWVNGRSYRGEYQLDKKDGYGAFEWEDGKVYEGFWRGGKRHGDGNIRHDDGCVSTTSWVRGKRATLAAQAGDYISNESNRS